MKASVQEEKVDVLDLWPGMNPDDVIVPTDETPSKATQILGAADPLSVLDGLDPDKQVEEPATLVDTPVDTRKANEILDGLTPDKLEDTKTDEGEEVEDDGKGVRAKTDKSALASYLKTKIEAKEFSVFDDYDEKKETLDQYLAKQPAKVLHEMLDANWDQKKKELEEKTPQEFFESLPTELQYAAKYVMEGGTDMRAIFSALGRVEEVKALDPSDEDDQEVIARTYLQATGFGRGRKELIEKQVKEWKESDKLAEKAAEFKPDLDDMQKEQVEYQLAQQAEYNKQRQQASQVYMSKVKDVIIKGDIGGIKLSKKEQADLYNGMVSPAYVTSSGQPTNKLGYLLDKIQLVEPNYELLAEVLMHLEDPKSFKERIGQTYKNTAIADVAKKLKNEQGSGTSGAGGSPTDDEPANTPKKIKRKSILEGWEI